MRHAKRCKTRPVIYAVFYGAMARVARRHGYALALHGSLLRDCDLVAIPWTKKASRPVVLVKALVDRVGGYVPPHEGVGLKPHGRLTWVIHVGGGAYLDLSVMPRGRR
jgi:hypothetical protein